MQLVELSTLVRLVVDDAELLNLGLLVVLNAWDLEVVFVAAAALVLDLIDVNRFALF